MIDAWTLILAYRYPITLPSYSGQTFTDAHYNSRDSNMQMPKHYIE